MISKPKYLLIVGGNSDIGKALASTYAQAGYNLYLACRNTSSIATFSSDISLRNNVSVEALQLDVLDFDSHSSFYQNLEVKPEGIITCVGYLDDQLVSQDSWSESLKSIQTNLTGLVSLMNIVASDFEKRKSGFIVGISSVAGDRGRASNYIYGSAKSAFSTYLSGLRNRLSQSNVHVMTVKPGFVFTKMTAHLPLPKLLTAQPKDIANDLFTAQKKQKNTLYTKWFWKTIMLIIKYIPEGVFKKLKL